MPHIRTFPSCSFQLLPSMRDANHRSNSFFLQRTIELLKSLIVCIEWIIPDGGIIALINDFENQIILSRTVDLDLDGLAVSRYRLAVF